MDPSVKEIILAGFLVISGAITTVGSVMTIRRTNKSIETMQETGKAVNGRMDKITTVLEEKLAAAERALDTERANSARIQAETLARERALASPHILPVSPPLVDENGKEVHAAKPTPPPPPLEKGRL